MSFRPRLLGGPFLVTLLANRRARDATWAIVSVQMPDDRVFLPLRSRGRKDS